MFDPFEPLDSSDISLGKPVKYEVLVENPEGNTTLGSTKFTPYAVADRIPHPEATQLSNFTFQSAFPNGTSIGFSVVVAPVRGLSVFPNRSPSFLLTPLA